jgi:hypothetical protein
MKIVYEGCAIEFRRVKDIEGEVDVNEGFYTFYQALREVLNEPHR